MKDHLTEEQTLELYMKHTAFGNREMEELRFHDAVNEAVDLAVRSKDHNEVKSSQCTDNDIDVATIVNDSKTDGLYYWEYQNVT